MYHNSIYPAPCVIGSHAQPKSSVLMTYKDLTVVTVDPISNFASLSHLPQIYVSPIIVDVHSMKRIPNFLMHNMDSINLYVPMLLKKDFYRTITDQCSAKSGSLDSESDVNGATSRSSTPSSVGNCNNVKANNSNSDVLKPFRKHTGTEKFSPSKQKYSLNQKHSPALEQKCNDQWDEVSQQIWKHYVKNRQPEEMYFRKMKLRNLIQNVLNDSFPNCGLWVVGSSVNGLGTNTSDMDMCLVLTCTEIDQQTEATVLLKCVQNLLQCRCSFIRSTELITAKVPILKFTDKLNIQVDLNINNTVGIANTILIRDYCCMDWRVQPLVLVIKKWAQDCNINNAKDMTLSSYSLTLMVLHYLQCGCHPFVLPCLQEMRPKRYMAENCVTWQDSHKELPKFKSRNTESLSDLLSGFFDYFSNCFDFGNDVMSVRLGRKFPKHVAMNYRSTKNKKGHWKYICIEEPFNRTNTACAVYDADSFARILTAFRSTWVKLKVSQDISAVLKL